MARLRPYLVAPPIVEPVSLAEMKQHLGVTLDIDDALIARKIVAARQYVENYIGSTLIHTTWELSLDRFPSRGDIMIPTRPLASVVSVAYADPTGGPQVVPATDYEVDLRSETGWIVPHDDRPWPATMATINAVRVTYVAGLGDDPARVPQLLREAIAELAAAWFENREGVSPENMRTLPFWVEDKLAQYRVWTF